MDVVYILGTGSRWNNNEIRYSLRGVERFLLNYQDVYIFGSTVSDLVGIKQIPMKENSSKENNIMQKILRACQEPSVSDPFLLFHDDHYLVKLRDAQAFPYYFDTTIENMYTRREVNDTYKKALFNSYTALKTQNLPTLHYDSHTPVLIHKTRFPGIMAMYPPKPDGYVIKSLYCNTLGVQPTFEPDYKIMGRQTISEIRDIVKIAKVISSGPSHSQRAAIREILKEIFPDPSKFETRTIQ